MVLRKINHGVIAVNEKSVVKIKKRVHAKVITCKTLEFFHVEKLVVCFTKTARGDTGERGGVFTAEFMKNNNFKTFMFVL